MAAWLLTSTPYGSWLPGDARGSITSVRDYRPEDPQRIVRIEHDIPGEPWEEAIPELEASARELMTGPPIFFEMPHAEALSGQFQETATFRKWTLHALAIMYNHFHIVVDVPGFVKGNKILGDFKAYGSRALNIAFGKPVSGTWWTYKGSKRILKDDTAVAAAIQYVLYRQPNPLLTWRRSDAPGADATRLKRNKDSGR